MRHGADFRFCDVMGWFRWDGRRWKLLSEERYNVPAEVMQSVFLSVRAIRNEAALGAQIPDDLAGVKRENFIERAGGKHDDRLDRQLKRDEDGSRGDRLGGSGCLMAAPSAPICVCSERIPSIYRSHFRLGRDV